MRKLSAISIQRSARQWRRRVSRYAFNPQPSTLNRQRRSATTLTEVLLSLMLMGIGVVTLASLFPISILRSVQATQQTHATILAYNARALVELNPNLLAQPNPNTRFYVVDPLGWNLMNVPPALQPTFGNDGATPTPAPVQLLPGPANMVRRNAGFATEAAAADLVTLPDSWVFQVDGFPTGSSLTTAPYTVTLPPDVDLSNIPFAAGETRITIFDVTGRFSHVRTVTNITPATGDVEFDRAVPSPFNLGQVRIETHERRYTWMLTVKRMPIDPIYDVVVFFRRSFSSEDETVHSADFYVWDLGPDGGAGVAGQDDDGDGTTDEADERGPGIWVGPDGQPGVAGTDDDNNGTVDDNSELGWPGSDDVRSDDRRNRVVENVDTTLQPSLKKGGYVLDGPNLEWYRIQSIEDIGGGLVNLVVDRDIVRESHGAVAVFMRGVVQVY